MKQRKKIKPPKKLKEFVVEIKEGQKWNYRSDHKNDISAFSNAEAVNKKTSVRIKQNGEIIFEREGVKEDEDEAINDLIDKWHESDSNIPLHEYLGWSEEKYKEWVELKKIKGAKNEDV